jgi:CheY-like chemotaxis protein
MSNHQLVKPINILLVEDNPGDADLAREALENSKMNNNLQVVDDGEKAMAFLRREGAYTDVPRPDLILLDLNLPKKDGRQVLAEIKSDGSLKRIPVVILTTSRAEEDVLKTYDLHANCFITKPIDLNQFLHVVRSIEDFWLSIVVLPPKESKK